MGVDESMPKPGYLGAAHGPSPIGCDDWGHAINLYVDGELDETERGGLESHLESCQDCSRSVKFEQALRQTLRTKVSSTQAPAQLRARLKLAIDAEDPLHKRSLQALRRLWSPVPVAAAGATALGITAWLWMGTSTDDIVRDLVARHSRHLPLEVQSNDPHTLEAWLADKVDFHVNVPRANGAPMMLLGARLSNVRDHAAVYLMYSTPQSPSHRVSMIVYDDPSNRPPVAGISRKIDDHDVYMANRAGYNVAVWKQNEVVYSLVSDREDDVIALVHAANQ